MYKNKLYQHHYLKQINNFSYSSQKNCLLSFKSLYLSNVKSWHLSIIVVKISLDFAIFYFKF